MNLKSQNVRRSTTSFQKDPSILWLTVERHRHVAKPIACENFKTSAIAVDRESKFSISKWSRCALTVDCQLLLLRIINNH